MASTGTRSLRALMLPAVLATLLAMLPCALRAAPGDLDINFGTGGLATATATGVPSIVQAVAWQDGKLLVATTSKRVDLAPGQYQDTVEYRVIVRRYNADGTLDTSFGTNGQVLLPAVQGGGDFGYMGAPRGPGYIRMFYRGATPPEGFPIVIYSDVAAGAALIYWGLDYDGQNVDRQPFLPYNPPSPLSIPALNAHTVGGIATDVNGNVVIAGTVQVDDKTRVYVRELRGGSPDPDDTQFLVTSFESRGVAGLEWDFTNDRFYLTASIYDSTTFSDSGFALVAIKGDLSDLDTAVLGGGGTKVWTDVQPAGLAVIPGATTAIRVAYTDGNLGNYGLDQVLDTGVADSTYGTAGTVTLASASGNPVAAGLARVNASTVLAVTESSQIAYWRTSDAGVDLGLTTPAFPSIASGAASAVATDGTFVAVAGSAIDGSGTRSNAITAFDDGGVLDTNFGGGLVTLAGPTTISPTTQAVVRQPTTGRLVAGTISCDSLEIVPATQPSCRIVLQGYTAGGAIDTGFGSGGTGTAVFPLRVGEFVQGLSLVSDGDRIVAAYQGYDAVTPTNDIRLVRFTPTGSPDAFGTGGADTIVVSTTDYAQFAGVAVDSVHRPLVLFTHFGSSSIHFGVARRLAAGGPDGSFANAQGIYESPGLPSGDDFGRGISVTPGTDRPVVAAKNNGTPLVVRLTTSGTLDTTFNATGWQSNIPGVAQGDTESVVVAPNGRIYISGLRYNDLNNYVAAFLSDGTPDVLFGGCGMVGLGYYAVSSPAIVYDPAGYVLLSGTYGNFRRFALAGASDTGYVPAIFNVPFASRLGFPLTYPGPGGEGYLAYAEPPSDTGVVVDGAGGYVAGFPFFRANTYDGFAVTRFEGGGPAQPSITLAGPTSVTVGANPAYTAMVGSGATGNVRFRFGCPSDGVAVALAAGTAASNNTFATPGTYTVSAVYEGDAGNAPVLAALLTVTVTSGTTPTTTTLASSVNPSVFGQNVHLTATVTGGTPTGTVTFKDNGVVIGTGAVSSGAATLDIASLAVATHPLVAEYGGDTTYAASASTSLNQVVGKANTSTSVAVAPASSRFGQSVTITATVSPVAPGTGPLTGSVTFSDVATVLSSVPLDASGQASINISDRTVGTHTINVDYAATATHNASTGSGSLTVSQADVNVSLVTAPNPPVYGQPVTLSSTVTAAAPGAGTPQGTLVFVGIDSVVLDVAGGASTSLWTPLPGATSLTAQYSGNASFNAGSMTINPTVSMGATTLTAYALSSPVVAGVATSLQAHVAKVGTGVNPTGSVSFSDSGNPLGTASVDAAGNATIAYTPVTTGAKTITYAYSGDALYASANDSFGLTVLSPGAFVLAPLDGDGQSAAPGAPFALPLRVKLTNAVGTPVAGQSIDFTANPDPASNATATLAPPSPVTDANGIAATLATASMDAGTYTVTALYGGPSGLTATFHLANVATTLVTGSGTSVTINGTSPPVTLAAAVDVMPPNPYPTGVTSFPFGLVGFRIEGLVPGASVQVVITFPGSVAGMQYYKYKNGGYFPLPGVTLSGNTATFTLTDGGIGDSDGVADGTIIDPGGPAIVVVTPPMLQGATSRKVHGTAGAFSLPLSP
jgi:uncharacterized delta-60 repeat protein